MFSSAILDLHIKYLCDVMGHGAQLQKQNSHITAPSIQNSITHLSLISGCVQVALRCTREVPLACDLHMCIGSAVHQSLAALVECILGNLADGALLCRQTHKHVVSGSLCNHTTTEPQLTCDVVGQTDTDYSHHFQLLSVSAQLKSLRLSIIAVQGWVVIVSPDFAAQQIF